MSRTNTNRLDGQAARLRRHIGLTVVELTVALLIAAVMVTLALPAYSNYRERVRIDQAKRDIAMMSAVISNYYNDAQAYPDSLSDVGFGSLLDPWGNPYGYLNLGDKKAHGHARKDHSLVPINTDFDLYSMGPDGKSSPPLTAKASRDDIVRANNGAFIGVAADY